MNLILGYCTYLLLIFIIFIWYINMRSDLVNTLVIIFLFFSTLTAAFYLGFIAGKKDIINKCKTFSSFQISEREAMLCVIKPLFEYGEGDLNYMRPNNSKAIKPIYKET